MNSQSSSSADRSANAARTRESIPPEYKTETLAWPHDAVVTSSDDAVSEVCNKRQPVQTQISLQMQAFRRHAELLLAFHTTYLNILYRVEL